MSPQAFKDEIDAIKGQIVKSIYQRKKPLAKDNTIYEENNSNMKTIQLLWLGNELNELNE